MIKFSRYSLILASFIGTALGVWHFFVPTSFGWYSYIPNAPIEIIHSINYINACFSFLLTGVSLLMLVYLKSLFEKRREAIIFYSFFVMIWAMRVMIQLVWPWPSGLQVWLVVAFSSQFIFAIIPMYYLVKNK